ncbi:MAG TPA: hypothetical protein VL986_00470 [Terracidiphilus sp.]|nr:hypothetical protein [Terracidiphilus sp.]
MHKLPPSAAKLMSGLVLAVALTAPFLTSGCAVHARVYDPYYHDYHDWNGETVYYNQWETETHRNHVEFKNRPANEQKEYWDWRHSHEQH